MGKWCNFKIQIFHGLYKEIKILKNLNIDKKKIPANFWLKKMIQEYLAVLRVVLEFKNSFLIIIKITTKITIFCEFMYFKAWNSNSFKKIDQHRLLTSLSSKNVFFGPLLRKKIFKITGLIFFYFIIINWNWRIKLVETSFQVDLAKKLSKF